MAGPVGGNGVCPEPRNPVVFRALVKQVAPGSLIKHSHKVFRANVISPAHRRINPLNNVFTLFIVKVTVTHLYLSLFA
jgi:hypothetical protein